MFYCEYLRLRTVSIDTMEKQDRFDLLLGCIRYYLMNQVECVDGKNRLVNKPCLLLKDSLCSAYEARPLKCRTYGIVPPKMHRRIVDEVSKETKISKRSLPLSIQCPFVSIKPEFRQEFGYWLQEPFIAKLEASLAASDRSFGISEKIQKEGYGFLSFHDWHLMSELGEVWMSNLTPLRKKMTRDEKEKFLADLKEAFRASFLR